MAIEKRSISLPREALAFVERYRKTHLIKTRSAVVQEALALLRERELEGAYREASAETHLDWDRLSSDGLTDEAW
jgi:antitoxin ParD1/3/4